MTDHIGPTEFTYTARRCALCKYHTMRLFISGRDPIYDHFCQHPYNDLSLSTFFDPPGCRRIGRSDATSGWCPVLKETE